MRAMRAITLSLLFAACGGTPARTATTAGQAQPSDAGEDWRGILQQLVGTWTFTGQEGSYPQTCQWIADSTFLSCHAENKNKDRWLIGWEPKNRHYVWWALAPSGEIEVFSGMAGVNDLQVQSASARVGMHREAPTRWTLKVERVDGGGTFVDGTLTTETAPAPATPAPTAKTSTEDWRSALEGLAGQWSFDGTIDGAPATFQEHCAWVPSSTFVACTSPGESHVTLYGWEPVTARYVEYIIDGEGTTAVLIGSRDGKSWAFAGDDNRVTMTRESPVKLVVKGDAKTPAGWKPVLDGVLTAIMD